MFPEAPIHRQISDGTELLVRPVQPRDRELLARGFEQFSDESRYLRFFVHKSELTDDDLSYLTDVDGVRHAALGALKLDAEGNEVPVGIARYVRSTDDSEVAEAAVAVIDSMQGRGVGKVLLRALSDLAYARGVRKFRCSVLVANQAMHKVLLELDPRARVVRSDASVEELEIELSPPSAAEEDTGPRARLPRLLRLAAERLISPRPHAQDRPPLRARVSDEAVNPKADDPPP